MTSAWVAQAHLLLVDLDDEEARLAPVAGLLSDGSLHLMTSVNPRNEIIRPPITVRE